MNIFVSYTTRDSYINVKLLCAISDVVSGFGTPFIDLIHNDSDDKQMHVMNKLLESDILLLLSSDSINDSYWVQWELREAQSNGIPVITIPASCGAEHMFLKSLQSMLFNEINKLTKYSNSSFHIATAT